MRLRRLLPLIALLGGLSVPANAPAAPLVGISENNPEMFVDPLFTPLKVTTVRLVTSWDVVTNTSDDGEGDELARVRNYITLAQARGIDVLVSFQHARGDYALCRRDKTLQQCHLPTEDEYTQAFLAFRAVFPTVKTYSPWNEVNHPSQPTYKKPKVAARFTDIAAANCAGCTIVAMDILDSADSSSKRKRKPTFKAMAKYVKAMSRALKTPKTYCGIHNYGDTNRFRTDGTKAMLKAMRCKQFWATETGGFYKFRDFWTKKTKKGCKTAEQCQLKATKQMFKLTKKYRQLKRLYVYTWFGNINRFDSGLVANGKPRLAYAEVAKRLR